LEVPPGFEVRGPKRLYVERLPRLKASRVPIPCGTTLQWLSVTSYPARLNAPSAYDLVRVVSECIAIVGRPPQVANQTPLSVLSRLARKPPYLALNIVLP